MAEFVLNKQLAGDCIEIGDLTLCRLLMMNDASYPWFILVPKVAGVEEIHDLSEQQQQQLIQESSLLSDVLKKLFAGDKMNVAALGNIVSQLHLHHIVRFKGDRAWPGPVWGRYPAKPYPVQKIETLTCEVVAALGDELKFVVARGSDQCKTN